MTQQPLLHMENVSVVFGGNGSFFSRKNTQVRAVNNVDLSVEDGEVVGLVGESGSGKSTLGRAAINLLKPTSGDVWFEGQHISQMSRRQIRPLRRQMQPVFQDPYASLNPKKRIGETIGEGIRLHRLADRKDVDGKIEQLLRSVGLDPDLGRRFPNALSGGQRQRVAIARALAVQPKLIIADEPVSALDVSIQAEIIELLQSLREKNNLAMLFISHDLAVVRILASRLIVLYLGNVVEEGPVDAIFQSPKHPYTEALLSAMPSHPGYPQRQKIILKGELPNPISPPSGCVFHPRCSHAVDACKSGEMGLKKVGHKRFSACMRDDLVFRNEPAEVKNKS